MESLEYQMKGIGLFYAQRESLKAFEYGSKDWIKQYQSSGDIWDKLFKVGTNECYVIVHMDG